MFEVDQAPSLVCDANHVTGEYIFCGSSVQAAVQLIRQELTRVHRPPPQEREDTLLRAYEDNEVDVMAGELVLVVHPAGSLPRLAVLSKPEKRRLQAGDKALRIRAGATLEEALVAMERTTAAMKELGQKAKKRNAAWRMEQQQRRLAAFTKLQLVRFARGAVVDDAVRAADVAEDAATVQAIGEVQRLVLFVRLHQVRICPLRRRRR